MIKPLNDTGSIKIISNEPKEIKLEAPIKTDPEQTIPNGIYRVIVWEKIRQIVVLAISVALFLGMLSLSLVFGLYYKTNWFAYIFPIIIMIFCLQKIALTYFEFKRLNVSLKRYREDLKVGLNSITPFLVKLYNDLYKKQVSHNWITIFMTFYGSIFTLVFWWLKDVNWWVFDFKQWIFDSFKNPNLVTYLLAASLVSIILVHVFFAISRKKRIYEMDAYFGQQIVPDAEIETMKSSRNKFYRRIFIFSILIILVLPIIILICAKYLAKRKK